MSQSDTLPEGRFRALYAVAQARIGNTALRVGGSALVAVLAASLLGHGWPLLWAVGLAAVGVFEHLLYRRLAKTCGAGQPAPNLRLLVAFTFAQSAYANILAAMFYFSPVAHGDTLAVFYLIAGLANAAATLRMVTPLAVAGASGTMLFLVGLPLIDYAFVGATRVYDLLPLVGAFAFLAFGVNLWRSLLASDAAHARAEAAALRERQAAAAAAAAKAEVIERINDELRTPLSALIGAADYLRRTAATRDARADAAAMAEAGAVLGLALGDVTEHGDGEVTIEPRATDPRALVRNVVNAFTGAAQDKGLELFLDIAPEAPALVEIDPLRVRQIVSNLVANAVRHTRHGGVRVRLQAQAGDGLGRVRLGFVVADTGAGMSRAQLALVLGRVQAPPDGPGRGLAISRRLAAAMGGKLGGKSELGQGSAFSLVLEAPVVAPARERAA